MSNVTIINEIYVILNTSVELDLKLNIEEFKIMIKKILISDKSYTDHCASELKKDINVLKDLLEAHSDKENLYREAITFINAFAEVLNYEKCSDNLIELEKDKLYYKAVLNNYFMEDYLINHNKSRFSNFKKEFYQIGVLISTFYKGSSEVIIKIIYAKVEELFCRYNFAYSLPECCKKVV